MACVCCAAEWEDCGGKELSETIVTGKLGEFDVIAEFLKRE
jgi:hypothetical protein